MMRSGFRPWSRGLKASERRLRRWRVAALVALAVGLTAAALRFTGVW
jgi:hypothetical protein